VGGIFLFRQLSPAPEKGFDMERKGDGLEIGNLEKSDIEKIL
jgi:hypothetical protein